MCVCRYHWHSLNDSLVLVLGFQNCPWYKYPNSLRIFEIRNEPHVQQIWYFEITELTCAKSATFLILHHKTWFLSLAHIFSSDKNSFYPILNILCHIRFLLSNFKFKIWQFIFFTFVIILWLILIYMGAEGGEEFSLCGAVAIWDTFPRCSFLHIDPPGLGGQRESKYLIIHLFNKYIFLTHLANMYLTFSLVCDDAYKFTYKISLTSLKEVTLKERQTTF